MQAIQNHFAYHRVEEADVLDFFLYAAKNYKDKPLRDDWGMQVIIFFLSSFTCAKMIFVHERGVFHRTASLIILHEIAEHFFLEEKLIYFAYVFLIFYFFSLLSLFRNASYHCIID